jgi:hypothetical protein
MLALEHERQRGADYQENNNKPIKINFKIAPLRFIFPPL